MTDDFDQRLDLCLRADFPLLAVDTAEEQRLLNRVAAVCRPLGRRCLVWDAAGGFRDLAPAPGNDAALAPVGVPLAALDRAVQLAAGTVAILTDLHHWWDDPMMQRRLRAFVRRGGPTPTLIVVGAELVVPAGLRDELVVLDLPLPSHDELRAAVSECARQAWAQAQSTPELLELLSQSAHGLTLAQARRVFRKALVVNGVLDERDIAFVHEEKRSLVRASEALEFVEPAETPDDVGGLAALKEWLRLRGHAFTAAGARYGLPVPRGVALIGLPGTGKSLVAKTIGARWGLPLLRLDIGALYGSLVGESEARARRALRLAEAVAPCVLWIDELEKALAHGSGDTGTSMRVFGTILTWMAERTEPCVVVATANAVEALPPEVLRRGRFDEVFFLDLPTAAERAEILRVHLRRAGRNADTFDVDALVAATDGFVGAELQQVVTDTLYTAFDAGREAVTADVVSCAATAVPLARSQREAVSRLRGWLAEGRARPAT